MLVPAGVLVLALTAQLRSAAADAAGAPSLTISQLKVTSSDGQFITLYNPTDATLNMSNYQLEYFNNFDLSKATSNRLIALSGSLPPHGYYMVNDDALLLCYRLTVSSLSLGFSSTAGLVEVLAVGQSGAGGAVTPALQDYVGWSKTASPGAVTLPASGSAFLERQPTDAAYNPEVTAPGAGSWQAVQPDSANPCSLVAAGSGSGSAPVVTGLKQLLPAGEPPATIVTAGNGGVPTPAAAVLPPADVGLIAPTVAELLPNPSGTGNDGIAEFIELYNPNPVRFDLSGFSLQVGTTSLHTYTFPAGTSLSAGSFTAFYSKETGLSLSNSGGQARLLDPFGNGISASGVYGKADDGQAWALAKGKWYWTTTPTPGKANSIKQPVSRAAAKTAAKAKAAKKTKTGGTTAAAAGTAGTDSGEAATSPIHLRTLALVGGGALLYGAYEYRTDLASRFNQLRRYFGAGSADRA